MTNDTRACTERACRTCGKTFTPTRKGAVNCSPECVAKARRIKEANKNNKRRVWAQLTRFDSIDPQDIYQRDEWVCGICTQSIDRKKSWPHPESASLDHIRPLSWGGSHTAANLQASHLRCNLSKGADGDMDSEAVEFRARAVGTLKDLFGLHGEWVPSPMHDELLVGVDGRVYNLKTGRFLHKATVIKGRTIRRSVAVLETLKGPRPGPHYVAGHINGDPNDYAPDNLVWRMPDWQEKASQCRRGHALKDVNIVGVNKCRCCGKAEGINNARGGTMTEGQVQALADEHYREMLEVKRQEWKPIPGIDGYSASRQGQIRKDKTGRLVKGTLEKGGRVHMFRPNGVKTRFDRSVMKAFGIRQPSMLHYPIHIDGNVKNHSISNLAWATQDEDPRCVAVAAA